MSAKVARKAARRSATTVAPTPTPTPELELGLELPDQLERPVKPQPAVKPRPPVLAPITAAVESSATTAPIRAGAARGRKPRPVAPKPAREEAAAPRLHPDGLPMPAAGPRTSVYRGETRAEAEAAYHADARIMVRMGYAPAAESFSTVFEHVINVTYQLAPERGPAVLAALDQPDGDSGARGHVAPPRRRTRLLGRYTSLPTEARILIRIAAWVSLAILACIAIGVVSGEGSDAVGIVGFGVAGLVLGIMTTDMGYERQDGQRGAD